MPQPPSSLAQILTAIALLTGLLVLSACDQTPERLAEIASKESSPQAAIQLEFSELGVATMTEDKMQIRASEQVSVNGQTQTIGYHSLFATGDENNGERFGQSKDVSGQPILFEDGSPYLCSGTNDGVGSGLDHISILQKNDTLYMVSQYECVIGSMYVNELLQDENGQLSVKPDSLQFIDQSSDFGGYVHCAGQTTPWQSHLSSEEYEPDARYIETHFDDVIQRSGNRYYDEMARYWQNDLSRANPYFYGWIPEVQIDAQGEPEYRKHFSMGRFSHELAYVMPDQKTVYLSDDGTNVGLYLFVADRAQDLSSGTLYAARWQQTSDQGLGQAKLHWISLGHANNAEIRKVVANKPKFSDLFESLDPNSAGLCTSGFRSINTTHGHECLKLKDINGDQHIDTQDEIIASRLETRRFAAMLGATTEFRKEEGISFNAQNNRLYVGMSEIARGMENHSKNGEANPQYDSGGPNHIRLPYNPCGGVYTLDVAANAQMNSDYIASNMSELIAGKPDKNNQCMADGLANPDNLSFLDDSNILMIGEDSSLHENNFVWAYDIHKQNLTRIFSAPLDAETTSPFWHQNINGFGYLTIVTQHPLEEQAVELAKKQSQAGYIGPFQFFKKGSEPASSGH
ncbi:MAG: DUF839 domain-containing protein [Thiomicrorhabdus chilensis]|uniref:PhoX family protein n=1 Tax=Thiomicrorhabdus chilensis TaxID=63656 RepID=UPI00299D4806|nr:alkaline phosphatase PhoX [Thiomicrorhabdus chilensis]MDX1347831.1 DUF839 domain-containing protein [Thiomicrorhabdus chilensis]